VNKKNNDSFRPAQVLVLGMVLFGFGLFGSAVWWRWRLAQGVNGQLRDLQAAGLPTSGAELDRWYSAVPDSQNAALVMTQAFALRWTFPDRRSNEVDRFRLPPRGQRMATNEAALLSEYVEMNAGALAKAREGLSLSKSRYPIDLSPGAFALLPHLRPLKTLAQTANFSVQVSLEAGRYAAADESIGTIVHLARTLDNEPILTSQLVRAAILNIAVTSLERRLAFGQCNESELVSLMDAFRSSQQSNLMARALIGERAMAIPYFRMSRAEMERLARNDEDGNEEKPSGPPLSGPPPTFLRVTGLFERDLNFFLRVMETTIYALSQPPPKTLEFTNSFEQSVLAARRKYYVLSSLFLPSLTKTAIKDAQVFARSRLAVAAIGVERFRLAKGNLPEDLRELVPGFLPSVPIDPFDGAPIRYRRLTKGYVVYSIGSDGHDDGGKEPPSKRRGTERIPEDITITVER